MRRFKYIGFLFFIIIYIIVVSGFISESRKNLTCKELNVIIKNNQKSAFISKKEISEIINKKEKVIGRQVKDIDLKSVEGTLKNHRSIESAETFMTEDGKLNVLVTFRMPVLRINNKVNRGYYLDNQGNIIPLSRDYSPRVLFANGNIIEPFNLQKTSNIFIQKQDGSPAKKSIIHDLLELSEFINNNDFWKSQIVQIYVNNKSEFELIPRVGAHIILFGSIDNYKEKFENLKTLYTEGFNKIGWNDYVQINLKYKDQIICTKK